MDITELEARLVKLRERRVRAEVDLERAKADATAAAQELAGLGLTTREQVDNELIRLEKEIAAESESIDAALREAGV
jgi:predicted  nucleic acid-binding Zn-ribbon protein